MSDRIGTPQVKLRLCSTRDPPFWPKLAKTCLVPLRFRALRRAKIACMALETIKFHDFSDFWSHLRSNSNFDMIFHDLGSILNPFLTDLGWILHQILLDFSNP